LRRGAAVKQFDEFYARNPGINLPDVFADVREAFSRLEAAISLPDPVRCRGYVSDSFYESLDSEVRRLADNGRRRIHADFEVLDVMLEQAGDAGSLTVRVRATSTLDEFDAGSPPVGDRALFRWSQDVVVVRDQLGKAPGRWLIAELGAMTIERQVSGPIRPLDQSTLNELDAREAERAAHQHEDQTWSQDQTHAYMNFLRLRGVGM
jgi:hypothetical protein